MKLLWVLCLVSISSWVHADKIEGVLVYEIGDAKPPSEQYHQRYFIQTETHKIPLSLSSAFEQRMPIREWAGLKVSATLKHPPMFDGRENKLQALELLEGVSRGVGGVTGPQPWVSILCKFSDKNAEPENLSFFQNMYANQPAGLDHYWREVSFNKINVVGSLAIDWVDLPSPQTTYIPNPGSNFDSDLDLLFDDCTDAADPLVNFATGANGSSFVGINMMFNDVLDCCAWGGGRFANLDGLQKLWRTTWNPPWAFANEGVIAHEMGHGFGLPHANNSDGDDNPYDSPWDVMSSATGYAVNDSVYGRLGKHINMHFKHNLGWVDDSDGFIANSSTDEVLIVNWTASTAFINYKFARIPLSDGTFYVIESRQASGQYESNIVDTAVIIHHVDTGRNEPPWVVDGDAPAANYADTEGVMWKVGETFVDPIDGYEVEVINQVTNGFAIRIKSQDDLIFADGFQ